MPPKRGRNTHLISPILEASKRGKLALEAAAKEMEAAASFYPRKVFIYKRKQNGRICSCTDKHIQEHKDDIEDELSLESFLKAIEENTIFEHLEMCPICFGTEIVGGYTKKGTQQIVLESKLNPKLNNIEINNERPLAFLSTDEKGEISWEFKLPKYFDEVVNIAIRWKEEPKNWKILINDKKFTRTSFLNNKGKKIKFSLFMKDSVNRNSGLYAIFIELKVSKIYIPCDLPLIRETITGDFPNVLDIETATANFSASLSGKLSPRDIFITEDGIGYKIISVEKGNPMDSDIFYTTENRIIRPFESYFMLPSKILYEKYYRNPYTFIA